MEENRKRRRRRRRRRDEAIMEELFRVRTKREGILLIFGSLAGLVTLMSSLIYRYAGLLVPGLSPISLSVLLFICGAWIHGKDLKDSFSFWLECIFLVAGLLNLILGMLQIAVFLNH